jgi:F-type H+-transporting ATPase subunit a|tara:strand:+ start:74 stop:847 length:774 start_codon:yes stop_codon:yes gene_type:complete
VADTNPIKQFEIHPVFDFEIGGLNLAFTNSSFFMAATVIGVTALMAMATTRRALVPGRGQSIAELLYEFVAGMIRSTAGTEGLRFFPFVFTLFMFILAANMLGMFPYLPAPGFHSFTVTSHIIVTFALSMLVMVIVVGYGVWKNGFRFLKLFVPSGVPLPLYLIVTPIEVISFLSRPLSLSVRLFANMLAGHILLKVFAGFVIMMGTAGFLGFLGAALPLFMVVALTALEFLVAFLQAYVFAILTCIYLNDALHPGH